MQYRESADLSGSRTRRAGGSHGRKQAVLGGGLGSVILVVLVLLVGPSLGINASDFFSSATGSQTQSTAEGGDAAHCTGTGVNVNENPQCRWEAYETAVQAYWSKTIPEYEYATMVLFTGTVQTACGTGQTQMGPFYCSGDTTVYIDDQFIGQLLSSLGATGGDAAEAYIVAHEYGHHVQNLDGTLRSAARDSGAESQQVRLELQADCYAGIFFHQTLKDPASPIVAVTQDDLMRITDAARAVGDDHIQREQGGFINPESWTHGSSEQRQRWVSIGFETGDPAACNTFATDNL